MVEEESGNEKQVREKKEEVNESPDNDEEIAPKKRRHQWPKWLNSLLGDPFFIPCEDHKEFRKNEQNVYCLDCDERICQNCLVCLDSPKYGHGEHNLLQIRRYVYQDVVRITDVHKILDCTKIQTFVVNGAKVILLNPKKGSKPGNYNGKEFQVCIDCGKAISDPNLYCSIACKVIQLEKFDDVNGELALISPISMVDYDVIGESSLMAPINSEATEATEVTEVTGVTGVTGAPPLLLLPVNGSFRKKMRKAIPIRSPFL